jgi:hypothetical protein
MFDPPEADKSSTQPADKCLLAYGELDVRLFNWC